jgi:hypothetical protein
MATRASEWQRTLTVVQQLRPYFQLKVLYKVIVVIESVCVILLRYTLV